MKTLILSRLSLVAVLAFAVALTTAAFCPQAVDASELIGAGCDGCDGDHAVVCTSKPDKTCNDSHTVCYGSGDGTCETRGASACHLRLQCVNESNQMCI